MRKIAAVVLAGGACLVPVADAAAHTMPKTTAVAVATKAVKKIARETNASSSRVTGCARRSNHRFLCKGEERYRTGASRCTMDITVRYTSTTRTTTKYAVTNYRCF